MLGKRQLFVFRLIIVCVSIAPSQHTMNGTIFITHARRNSSLVVDVPVCGCVCVQTFQVLMTENVSFSIKLIKTYDKGVKLLWATVH